MRQLAVQVIKLYRICMLPMRLQCCRYYPSCSQYAQDAIEKYGCIRGMLKGLKRILRCHPLSKGGYDPVE